MLDINFVKENKEKVKKVLEDRNFKLDLEKLLDLDVQRRDLILRVDELRQEKNLYSQEKNIEKGKEIKKKLVALEPQLAEAEKSFNELLLQFPNIPLGDVPVGKDASFNQVLRKWGEKRILPKPKDHVELGEKLGIIDIETAAKVSGSRFAYLKAEGAVLQFALISFTLDILQDETKLAEVAKEANLDIEIKKFIPVVPPVLIKPDVYTRMGRLDPTVIDERYYLQKDDLYLIGSAEHTLGPLHMDETINEKDLPIRYIGYSTSFRREAGAYGQDVRGILRVHQFDKLEMETFTLPQDSEKEQNFIVKIQEYLMQQLGIPYQVIIISTGDMTTPDARQIDIESWIPSQNRYRETHTSDLMTDYQSRRLNTKVKRSSGKVEFVHMNDATAFAIGRTIIAILENFQQEDGSVEIPKVLVPYTKFSKILPKEQARGISGVL